MTKQAADSQATGPDQSKRWSEQEARRTLAELDKSGETIAAFARRIGVVPKRLSWWRKRLAQTTNAPPSVAFVPVTVRTATDPISTSQNAPVVLSIGARVRVDIHNMDAATAAWVAALLLNLEEVRS